MEKKKPFAELKAEFMDRCRAAAACSGEFRRLSLAETDEEMLQVIGDNLGWCVGSKVIDHEFLSHFDPEKVLKAGIGNLGKDNTGFANSGNWNSGDSNSGNWNSGDSNSGNWNSGNWNSGNRNSGDSNSGYRNSGNWNSGNWNSGYRNSGNWNSGNRNSGDSNSGNWNSGNWNSGNRNSGDSNSGYRNSGNWNSGNWNSGDSNSGNWNSGNRNSGDSNSGYRNSGAFCTNEDPEMILFDKPCGMTVREWENTRVCNLMYNINPNIWVPSEIMTPDEKKLFPSHETTGGYLKRIPMKDAWADFWNNLTEESRALFTNLPNFDPIKFEQITGIKTA